MRKLTPIYDGLGAYEAIRYRLKNDNGSTIGFVSRYHHDGRDRWYAWREDGLRCEVHTRHQGVVTLEQSE